MNQEQYRLSRADALVLGSAVSASLAIPRARVAE